MTEAELFWAVGLFEGEGHIGNHAYRSGVNATAKRYMRCLVLGMCDEDVVRRFHRIVGVGRVYALPPKKEGWSPAWRWQCAKWDDIEQLLIAFLPHLGNRRRAKALELLANPAMTNKRRTKTHCKRGHPLDGDNVYYWTNAKGNLARHCRTCHRVHERERQGRQRLLKGGDSHF